MRLGYFTMPVHPMHRTWVETLKQERDFLKRAAAYIAQELRRGTP